MYALLPAVTTTGRRGIHGTVGQIVRARGSAATPLEADPRLGRVLDAVLDCCEYALFAGEGAAAMAERLARQRPDRECLACEPGGDAFYAATARTAKVKKSTSSTSARASSCSGWRDGKPYLLERDTLVVLHVPGGGAERRVFDEVAFVAESFGAAFLLVLGAGARRGGLRLRFAPGPRVLAGQPRAAPGPGRGRAAAARLSAPGRAGPGQGLVPGHPGPQRPPPAPRRRGAPAAQGRARGPARPAAGPRPRGA
jgi:hypothetical protein